MSYFRSVNTSVSPYNQLTEIPYKLGSYCPRNIGAEINRITTTCPTFQIPSSFPNSKIQPTRHLRSKFQIENGNQIENGSAVPSQSTSPTSPLSKSTPNCLLSASFRNSLSSYKTRHSHSSLLPKRSTRMSLTAKSSKPSF